MKKTEENQKPGKLEGDNRSWEDLCNCKILQRHHCEEEKPKEKKTQSEAIFKACFEGANSSWVFAHAWIAGEQDVRDGEADDLGEVISAFCCQIAFCPFCGERLEE